MNIKDDLNFNDPICDIGSGSGIVLHTLSLLGYNDLTGVEYGIEPYNLSLRNLSKFKTVNIYNENAFEHNYQRYKLLLFFSPFRDQMAADFFLKLKSNAKYIITINHSKNIEPILKNQFNQLYSFDHPIYENFNGIIWKKRLIS